MTGPTFGALLDRIAAGHLRTVVRGSRGSSTSIVAGALAVRLGRPVLLVVAHPEDAQDALEELRWFDRPNHPLPRCCLAAMEALGGQTGLNLELLSQRLQVVEGLCQGGGAEDRPPTYGRQGVCVAPIHALMQAVPTPDTLRSLSLTVRGGQQLSSRRLLAWLANAGYERVEVIEHPGEFAVRGGIVDIFLPAGAVADANGPLADNGMGGPVRLDYFGDQVDSISRIDPQTMGSSQSVDWVQIVGATADQVQSDQGTTHFMSMLADETVVVLHEMLELAEQARGYYERLTDPRGIYPPAAVFRALTQRTHLEVNQYSGASDQEVALDLPVEPLPTFEPQAPEAVQQLAQLAYGEPAASESGAPEHRVVVLCQKPAERERLMELIHEHADGAEQRLRIEVGYLHRGFIWRRDGGHSEVFLVPHHELFHRYDSGRAVRRVGLSSSSSVGRASDAFLDVEVGDYVVHADHGIARFDGLKTMRRRGRTQEYLTLQFANQAHLHVPATQIELVQKYIGGFHGKPPLSQLGGKRWAKQKQHVAEAVKDMAAELLRVQAARASMPGIRYPPDTPWQRRFEAEFPYKETEDQIAAIGQIKKDMNQQRPMDRLICGDVGFGKTEVAIRAAFKAIEYGKQVAVLVPTTVLAEQHERTFCQRMVDYPFRVESISRFKTAAAATRVLNDLERGQVDVIIGTHRLLSGDVKFADLGLVVIDEEQRFGVEHKQTLMRLRLTVDVLTLSATPIPRTLHMSMLGLRDISSLTIPPLDRRAIVTEVIPYDAQRIKQAILRELNRDGQVYFVHNRVHSIQSAADEVQKLVPTARLAIGHGQMPGHELEQVMLRFLRRKVDVLVCTTIIESGLDIPTANTIFINEADRFGLADLHQLRGRVGRYKHRAYCYLLLPADRPVTDVAAKRLRAIEQYAVLGAGFKIAMRDLEIRGAGNLLGVQQSGHIASVGYEMYCRLLEKAAKRLRHESIVEPIKTHIELPVSGWLPRRYIGSEKYRMEGYRRLSRAASLEHFEAVSKDFVNAYGTPPGPAQTLLDLTELRIAVTLVGVDAIKLDGPDVIFRTASVRDLQPRLKNAAGRVSVIDDTTVYWRPPANYLEPGTLLTVLRKLFVGSS